MTSADETASSSLSWPGASALDLEDMLDELRARVFAARRSQERMSELLDAVVAVSSDLDLADVLSRIVHSATSLVGARYGALGVLSSDGERLVEFVTHGVTTDERAMMGHPPLGRGVLGLLIRDPRPVRMPDISNHPESFGFPANHPSMRSFLGAPIQIRDEVFGNLYLAEKLGADEFTEEDEAVLVALAAAAGVAIDNARLYDASRRQRRWSDAVGELTQVLLEHEDEDTALRLLVTHTASLSRAARSLVAMVEDADQLHVVADSASSVESSASGDHPTVLTGAHWAEVRSAKQPILLSSSMSPHAGLRDEIAHLLEVPDDSPLAVIPLPPGHGDLGILVVAWDAAAESLPAETMPALIDYAQQAGLALLAGRAQRDRARTALLDDRDRIARDMHDHVIQRLFATGLSLQSVSRLSAHPVVQPRIEEAVDDLDAAIKEIRQAIFELHRPLNDQPPEAELRTLVSSFRESLGFEPALHVEGPFAEVPAELRSDALAVVREGLSNVSRQAHATMAAVRVVIDGSLCVEVTDDGVGVERGQARGGLVNLAKRAAAATGAFEVLPNSPGGTLLRWRVPV